MSALFRVIRRNTQKGQFKKVTKKASRAKLTGWKIEVPIVEAQKKKRASKTEGRVRKH